MELASNPFAAAIREGEKQIGLWITLANSYAAQAVATAGYDWVLVDMEHSPNDLMSVLQQLQAFESGNSSVVVRPVWNDSVLVKQLLDIGSPGLLFPMVQSVEEAEAAVAATRYPPRGIRGVTSTSRANKFGRVTDYFERIEDETVVIVQLETRAAVERAEQIAAVDGVDGVFFGPADIAADIGLLAQPLAPQVWDLIRPAAAALMEKGTPVGTLVGDPEFAISLLNDGFTFVACGSDSGLLARGADALLSRMRNGLV